MKKEEQVMKSSVTRHKQKDVARFHHHKVDSENRKETGSGINRGKSKTEGK